jgi:hypothetical protein
VVPKQAFKGVIQLPRLGAVQPPAEQSVSYAFEWLEAHELVQLHGFHIASA